MAQEKRMGVIEHIEELRSRLIISLIAILVTTALAYFFSDTILSILTQPAGGLKLVAFSPMDGFMIRFRIALYGGVALAAPVWIYQLVRYLEPGLLPTEKRFIIPGVAGAVLLFFLGNLFGYYMLSKMLEVMFSMFGTDLQYLPSADQYISFIVYFLLAIGISFELPVVILILMKLGIITPDFLRKQRRVAYFVLFMFAELITPVADPIVAPMVVMIPMLLLFELALFLSRFVVAKPKPASTIATTPGASQEATPKREGAAMLFRMAAPFDFQVGD
jgi:sec-independent protein translocase protein TatC